MPQKQKTANQHSELRSRIWLILIVLAMIAFTIWASGPVPDKNAPLYPTPTPTLSALSTGTVLPTAIPEIIEKTPTTGVIFGAVIIVLILVVGVLISLRAAKN